MKWVFLLTLAFALSGCSVIPQTPSPELPGHTQTEMALPVGDLVFCTQEKPDKRCEPGESGLVANGLGGLFLPLRVRLNALTLEEGTSTVKLAVNDIGARCTKGTSEAVSQSATISISGIYCSWLGIGNVVASLHLVIDSAIDPAVQSGSMTATDNKLYSGRYRIRFLGTGNGSGSGYFMARHAS